MVGSNRGSSLSNGREFLSSRRAFLGAGVLGVSAVAGCLESFSGSEGESESWPMFQFDTENTGHGETTGPKTGVEIDWQFDTGTEAWNRVASSPAVVDGTVYVGNDNGVVYALDAESGAERWQFSLGSIVRTAPAPVDGAVHVGSRDGTIYRLTEQ